MFRLTSRLCSFFAVAILAATLVSDASGQAKKPKPKPRRPQTVGPAIGGNKATPVNPVQLQLFQSLAEMTTQDPNVLLKELDALDEKRLAAADKRLLQR